MFMNRKTACAFALVLLTVFSSCTSYDDEKDFKVSGGGQLYDYVGKKKTVRIPPQIEGTPLTIIMSEAFKAKGITGITLPDTIKTIGRDVFMENPIKSVNFPAVVNIGDGAFRNLTTLTSVSLPAVTFINTRAFLGCNSLASVTLGTIEEDKFYLNNFPGNLRDVYLAEGGGAGTYVTDKPGENASWRKK